uniref:TIR domain-containing protein n=1 Tax=Candidatus Kentrum sp. MB TaxID=2138164 RepID=A0A450X0R3_9GAMM|nr:MAG: TIR domain-containing protein [Candidatus Kentron sp. MB]
MTTVFISSTGLDLKEYRQAAMEECTRLGLIPIVMEFFEAMGVGAVEGSKRKLDEADLYVGIFAHRYGYIEAGQEKSVTEIEFDHAGARGLDRVCFVIDPGFDWPPDKIDFENYDRLKEFKARVEKDLIRARFSDINDFRLKFHQALDAWLKRSDLPESEGTSNQSPASKNQRIALLYKRNAEPDEHLLHLLERELTSAGHSIFIDRHLNIGVEWAKQIDREIHQADAVIPLLSKKSVHSEMLLSEMEIARQAASEQNGKPRILPLRIQDEGPLPNELDTIIGRLQYSLWRGPEDDDKVVRELSASLNSSAEPDPKPVVLEMMNDAVPLDSEFYVARETDQAFQDAVARRDTVVLLKGARQMGKTSLLIRGLHRARESGVRVAMTDFQRLTAEELSSLTRFYFALGDMLADQLDIAACPKDAWEDTRSPNVNFERWLRREVLGKNEEPLLWGIDEADRLFDRNFGGDVFALFRAWHNERAFDIGGPWSRLTLAIVHANEAHLFISDLNQSPFNIGTRITLDDFTLAETTDLNRRHGSPLREGAELLGVLSSTGWTALSGAAWPWFPGGAARVSGRISG